MLQLTPSLCAPIVWRNTNEALIILKTLIQHRLNEIPRPDLFKHFHLDHSGYPIYRWPAVATPLQLNTHGQPLQQSQQVYLAYNGTGRFTPCTIQRFSHCNLFQTHQAQQSGTLIEALRHSCRLHQTLIAHSKPAETP